MVCMEVTTEALLACVWPPLQHLLAKTPLGCQIQGNLAAQAFSPRHCSGSRRHGRNSFVAQAVVDVCRWSCAYHRNLCGPARRAGIQRKLQSFHARVDFRVKFIWEPSNVEIRRSVSAICENKPGQLQKQPTSWRGPVSSLLNSSSVRWSLARPD